MLQHCSALLLRVIWELQLQAGAFRTLRGILFVVFPLYTHGEENCMERGRQKGGCIAERYRHAVIITPNIFVQNSKQLIAVGNKLINDFGIHLPHLPHDCQRKSLECHAYCLYLAFLAKTPTTRERHKTGPGGISAYSRRVVQHANVDCICKCIQPKDVRTDIMHIVLGEYCGIEAAATQ